VLSRNFRNSWACSNAIWSGVFGSGSSPASIGGATIWTTGGAGGGGGAREPAQ